VPPPGGADVAGAVTGHRPDRRGRAQFAGKSDFSGARRGIRRAPL